MVKRRRPKRSARALAGIAAAQEAVPYVPVGAAPGNAQTAETKAGIRVAIAFARAKARSKAAVINKAKAKEDGRQVFVPTVKLTVAGNVEDLRGGQAGGGRWAPAPKPKKAPAYHPPLVQPKPTPTKVKPAEVHPVYASAAAAVGARKPTGSRRKQF